jgi:hypothetical protein
MSGEDNNEVYNNLTEAVNPQKAKDVKFKFNLSRNRID